MIQQFVVCNQVQTLLMKDGGAFVSTFHFWCLNCWCILMAQPVSLLFYCSLYLLFYVYTFKYIYGYIYVNVFDSEFYNGDMAMHLLMLIDKSVLYMSTLMN